MKLNTVLANNMKPNLVLVSKTILQLLLFCLFLGFFGIPSFNQYQRKETIIVKSELETTGIEAPAVTLQATQNKFGWKSIEQRIVWHEFDLYEHCENINMTIEQCIQNDTITLSDFLANVSIENNFVSSVLLNMSSSLAYWTEDMSTTAWGKQFTFKPPKSITLNQDYCMTFSLFKNFTFFVMVHDEDFFFNNANPLAPPVNYWTFNGLFQRNAYQELTLTKHKKLNLEQRPCEEDPDYSFIHCIKENSAKKVKKKIIGLKTHVLLLFCM